MAAQATASLASSTRPRVLSSRASSAISADSPTA
jgi:hypothetical protein